MNTGHHIPYRKKNFAPGSIHGVSRRTLALSSAAPMKFLAELVLRHAIVHVDLREGQLHAPLSDRVLSMGSIFRNFTVRTSRDIC